MIFITGATGLIGSFVCRELLSKGYRIKALKRKTSDFSLVQDIQGQISWIEGDLLHVAEIDHYLSDVDKIVHCAAFVSYDRKDEEKMWQINVEGTANLVNAALRAGIDRFLHVSSVASIGKDKISDLSTEETQWTEGENKSAYARSKHQAELEVWRGWAEGLATVIINPSVVLGPGDWDKSSTQIFKYIREENRFYTGGIVNYVDVRDVSAVAVHLLESDIKGERFILNAGSLGYKELFDTIAEEMGKKPPAIKVEGGMIKMAILFEKIRSKLSGKPPLVTDELEQVSSNRHTYANSKIKQVIDINFTDFKDTIQWCCQQLSGRSAT
jgi:nucleoside-diphosphate-sugar epimerase